MIATIIVCTYLHNIDAGKAGDKAYSKRGIPLDRTGCLFIQKAGNDPQYIYCVQKKIDIHEL